MYYVYILKNNQRLYKGFSANLQKRIAEHHNGLVHTTSKGKDDYELIWYAAFQNRARALEFERYIKEGSGVAFTNKHLIA